jgi:hypothetical protein
MLGLCGCERGCARSVVQSSKAAELGRGLSALSAVDCPDGLARCEVGTVSASRVATVPLRCKGPASACTCPWDVVGECVNGCVAEGVEMVVDAPLATAQLCAPGSDAGAWFVTSREATPEEEGCDEGDAYRCSGGVVVDCRLRTPIGRCTRGCYRDGTSVPAGETGREEAFALLCSR